MTRLIKFKKQIVSKVISLAKMSISYSAASTDIMQHLKTL